MCCNERAEATGNEKEHTQVVHVKHQMRGWARFHNDKLGRISRNNFETFIQINILGSRYIRYITYEIIK